MRKSRFTEAQIIGMYFGGATQGLPRLHKDTFIFVRERRKSAASVGDTDACSNK